MAKDHGFGGEDSRGSESLADDTSLAPMHLFIYTVVGIVDCWKIRMRSISLGLLRVASLAVDVYISVGKS